MNIGHIAYRAPSRLESIRGRQVVSNGAVILAALPERGTRLLARTEC